MVKPALISVVTNLENSWKNVQLKLKLKSPVLGISSSSESNKLLLRHKSSLNLIKITDINNSINSEWTKKFNQTILDSKLKQSKLGVVFFNCNFKFYDLETNKQLDSFWDDLLTTKFEFDSNSIALLSLNKLHIYDLRSKDAQIYQSPFNNTCDNFTTFKINRNSIYIASRHSLIQSDLRKVETMQHCSHLMKSSPCFIDFVEQEHDGFLCLSGQKSDEKVLFTGNPVNSLPLLVPSLGDNLIKCRTKKDLFLKDKLDERINLSTIGIKLLDENNGK